MIIVFANRRIKRESISFSEHLFFINRYDRCVFLDETDRVSSENRGQQHMPLFTLLMQPQGGRFSRIIWMWPLQSISIYIFFLLILNQDNLGGNFCYTEIVFSLHWLNFLVIISQIYVSSSHIHV